MPKNLATKIIQNHIAIPYSKADGTIVAKGQPVAGQEIAIKIDQTLTQDTTGTMAYLQFEALGFPRVQTKKSVAYIDHNILQVSFENADDHRYIQTAAAKYGIYFSRPGNGICHQIQLERFAVPGDTLLGSDSHTPTCGGIGMLAIGAGGLDVAVAMGGGPYYLNMPEVVNVNLLGKLSPWVSAKDIILELLRRLTVKGGVGKIFEYTGEGVSTLTVPERATIANMGAELGATTSIFPSDKITRDFLRAQGREEDWQELMADPGAHYDQEVTIDLSELEPLVACPHSPDNVVKLTEAAKIKLDQVCIGSCTNSSYLDMMKVAAILKGHTVHPGVSLTISPGSKQVLAMMAANGILTDMINAGARILECACGPCIGMGQAPATDAVSLRTFNRNYFGRSGTTSAKVYLSSPEVAAISAITGELTDPRTLKPINFELPPSYLQNDNLIISPPISGDGVEVVRGPNIKPFPSNKKLPPHHSGFVLLKMGDNITTDHIMPSPANLLPLRSNVPALAEHCLVPVAKDFPKRAKEKHGGFLVAGENYGQGSSREHAALVPLYLGVKGVLALSFSRIHMANLINSGIIPLTIINKKDYQRIKEGDDLMIENLHEQVLGSNILKVWNLSQGYPFPVQFEATVRLKKILLEGGLLPYTKSLGPGKMD